MYKSSAVLPSQCADIMSSHAYATTIGINKVFKRLGKSKQEMLNVHLTLLDIHPGILARDLVLMMLAYELGDENLDPVDKLEIQATAIYTFAGVAMPSYCAERLVCFQ